MVEPSDSQTVLLGALAARLTLTDTALAGSRPDCFTKQLTSVYSMNIPMKRNKPIPTTDKRTCYVGAKVTPGQRETICD